MEEQESISGYLVDRKEKASMEDHNKWIVYVGETRKGAGLRRRRENYPVAFFFSSVGCPEIREASSLFKNMLRPFEIMESLYWNLLHAIHFPSSAEITRNRLLTVLLETGGLRFFIRLENQCIIWIIIFVDLKFFIVVFQMPT